MMQHDSASYRRALDRGICALALVFLSACGTHTYQNDKGRESYIGGHQGNVRLHQLFRLSEEMTIWDRSSLPGNEHQDYNYLPYAAYCARVTSYACPTVVMLPAGTVIEVVGINDYRTVMSPDSITPIFAVQDHPELDTLLFEWDDRDLSLAQRKSRHPWLEAVSGNSQWTAARLEKIAHAPWVKKHGVNMPGVGDLSVTKDSLNIRLLHNRLDYLVVTPDN